jgi:predicted RNA-binding Zn-ribbon protein involved in translation (DUF1610 family)
MFGDPRNKSRYPSPFFDISQQYIPPTIKELFKWVYFYSTNNSFLGPALGKIARYPITDLLLDDPNQKIVDFWQTLLNNTLQVKTFNMEVNLDLTTYGNAFVTIHYPFARFLECPNCKERVAWKAAKKRVENLTFKLKCKKCGNDGKAKLVDVPYKSIENLRLLRINPEFIEIKFNEASGRHTYLYSIPDKLKRQIMAGDPDILEDTPAVFLDAIKQRRKIKLSNQNLFHLKTPTLAGKDMGWGMPRIAVALKDLYYFYTLRRGQEAVINEHIVPFDIIFPQANGKMDPYVHTDLSSWREEMVKQLAARRRDPNYKAILPFPIGYERIGGDGKALMLTPELDFLSKTIVGACGIPQEFVYGGTMQWSGSSISLRTLENDFLHHRSQLLQMNIWLVERVRLYLGLAAPKSIKFSDFKMADDVQKLQLLIGMASNGKIPWEDIWKELGRDPVTTRQKLEDEAQFDARIQEGQLMRQAEAQSKAQQVQARYQDKQMRDQAMANNPAQEPPPQEVGAGAVPEQQRTIEMFAKKLLTQPPEERMAAIQRLGQMDPQFAQAVANTLMAMEQKQGQGDGGVAPSMGQPAPQPPEADKKPKQAAPKPAQPKAMNLTVNMKPTPEQRPPRRKGGI